MTDNNNAAQPGLNDTIRAVFLEHGFTIKEGQTDLKPYVYEAVHALLSKLRAEGVQARDERADLVFDCGKAAGRQEVKNEQQSPDFQAWIRQAYREPESAAYTIYNMEVAYQAGRAALASAPVAGAAQRPVAYAVHGIDARGKIRVAAVKPWAGDESLCDSDGLGDMWSGNEPLVYGDAAPQASDAVRPDPDAIDLARAGMELHSPGMPEHTVCAELVRLADALKSQPQADKDGAQSPANRPESRASIESKGGALDGGDCAKGAVIDLEAAAKALSECMDYPWAKMPEKGRAHMREHAQTVINAALAAQKHPRTDGGGHG